MLNNTLKALKHRLDQTGFRNKFFCLTLLPLTMTLISCDSKKISGFFSSTENNITEPSTNPYSDATHYDEYGLGTLAFPYLIYTKAQIHDIALSACGTIATQDCGAIFKIMNDIDMNNEAMATIGSNANPYTGSILGEGKSLSNISINLATQDCVGFIGDSTGSAGQMTDLTLTSLAVIGQNKVGSILGCGSLGLSNISVLNGSVLGASTVGGVIGESTSASHSNLVSEVEVSATTNFAGGLVGLCDSCSLSSSSTKGNVTGISYLGGLVGSNTNAMTLSSVRASGNVSGVSYMGGLVGSTVSATVSKAIASGRVYSSTGSATHFGGLVGELTSNSNILNSIALGDVRATNATTKVGGIAGSIDATSDLTNVVATGEVFGADEVGGIAGFSYGPIYQATYIGHVSGTGYKVGGICGDLYTGAEVKFSYAKASIYASGGEYHGGLVGRTYSSSLSQSIFKGNVTSDGDKVGGIVGLNSASTVYSNFGKGSIVGSSTVGGIAGTLNISLSQLYDNQFDGSVFATAVGAGGVVGYDNSNGTYRNRFDGYVIADDTAGGHTGRDTVTSPGPTESYVDASVYSPSNGYSFIGNHLGTNPTKNFWSSTLSSINGSNLASGVANSYEAATAIDLKTASTFGGTNAWNFSTTWSINDGVGSPVSKAMLFGECSDYVTETSYSSIGSGTSSSPYLICNIAQYNDIATNACGTSTAVGCDKYFRLGASIDFRNSFPNTISSTTNVFSGDFDGQGFELRNIRNKTASTETALFTKLSGSIRNLKISNYSIEAGGPTDYVASLVVYLADGQIINVNVTNLNILTLGNYTGGLVAEASGGIIVGSSASGTISALNFAGGLVGYSNSSLTDLIISNSSTFVSLTGNGGGLFGESSISGAIAQIFRSLAAGNITATTAGGIAKGNAEIYESVSHVSITSSGTGSAGIASNSSINDSYTSNANITGSTDFGGALGINSTSNRSFSTNTISATGGGFGPVDCTQVQGSDNFWDSNNAAPGCSNLIQTPKTSVELTAQATFTNWDFTNIWTISEGLRPPRLRWELHPVCQSNMTATAYNSIGSGTFTNPYYICFKEQLHDLANNGCNNSILTACSSTFYLLNDIDFEGDTFNMIGGNTNNFLGTFDGRGHRLSNFTIGSSITDYVGFIRFSQIAFIANIIFDNVTVFGNSNVGIAIGRAQGPIDSTHVSNITILNSSITAQSDYVGGLVGLSNGVSLQNIEVNATIVGNGYIGGVVGSTNSAAALYENIQFAGTVSASADYAGGLVGYCSAAKILTSSASGTVVSTTNSTGGLCGYGDNSTQILNSKALNDITGIDYIGGLVGRTGTSTIENNFYQGTVTASGGGVNKAGCIGLEGGGSVRFNLCAAKLSGITNGFMTTIGGGTYTNNYWDSDESTITTGGLLNNYEPKTTIELKNEATYTGWDFFEKWTILPTYYPEPKNQY